MNCVKEELVLPNDLTAVCRLCLTANDKLFQLFRPDELETSAVPLAMKVSLCTAVRVSRQDILPHKICQNCMNYINEWYKFRRKCISNDLYLKKHICSTIEGSQPEDMEKIKNCDFQSQNNKNNENPEILVHNQLSVTQVNNEFGESSKPSDNLGLVGKERSENNIEISYEGKSLIRTPKKKYKCNFCPDSFYYLKDLKLHKSLIHKSVKSEKLPTKNVVSIKDTEVKFEESNVRTRYEMKCCEKVFYSKIRFRKHFHKKHPGEKPYMCETCGKKDFISEETLKRHKILHTGKYRCDICSKTFTCNAILIIHKRDKHENDKPFICDVCGKRFVTELLMNYHKRFHTGEKKYVCEECGLAVVTSSSLAKHKRIHSNVKPHVCQVCGKGFIIKGRLVEHLRVHTGERPYSCHICHKGFTMRDKLKRHIRIHSGEKLFSCEYCGNNYSTSYGLTVHLKSHIVRNY